MAVLSDIKKANGARPGGLRQHLTNGGAVGEGHHPGVNMGRRDPLDGAPDAVTEHLG